MARSWKNSLLCALVALFPLGSAMSAEVPLRGMIDDEKDTRPMNANERIEQHISAVREEVAKLGNSDLVVVYDQFANDLQKGYGNEIVEGDIHQVLEGVSFAAETNLGREDTSALQKALLASKALTEVDHNYDKDALVVVLLESVPAKESKIQEIKGGFGEEVANHFSPQMDSQKN